MPASTEDPPNGDAPGGLQTGRGPALMIVAALCFTLMVACVKTARVELSAFEVIFWRSVVGLPLMALGMGDAPWRIRNRRAFAARGSFGVLAMLGYYTAARGLDVADLSLVGRLQPLGVAALAPLAIGQTERSEGRLWVLLGVGLVGCAVLLGPDLAVGNGYGLIALGGVAAGAAAHTSLRALGATDDPRSVVLGFQVVALMASGIAVLIQHQGLPALPSLALAPWLVGVGLFALLGQLLMTRAYREDRAALVSAASHISPLWAVLADLLIFGVRPGWNVLLGGGIVLTVALIPAMWALRAAPRGTHEAPPHRPE